MGSPTSKLIPHFRHGKSWLEKSFPGSEKKPRVLFEKKTHIYNWRNRISIPWKNDVLNNQKTIFVHGSTWKTLHLPNFFFRHSTNPQNPPFLHTSQGYINSSREKFQDVILYCQGSSPARFQVTYGLSTVWRFRNPAHQLRLGKYPTIWNDGFQTNVRWLGMGFLNHQLYDSQTCPLRLEEVGQKVTPFPNRWS